MLLVVVTEGGRVRSGGEGGGMQRRRRLATTWRGLLVEGIGKGIKRINKANKDTLWESANKRLRVERMEGARKKLVAAGVVVCSVAVVEGGVVVVGAVYAAVNWTMNVSALALGSGTLALMYPVSRWMPEKNVESASQSILFKPSSLVLAGSPGVGVQFLLYA